MERSPLFSNFLFYICEPDKFKYELILLSRKLKIRFPSKITSIPTESLLMMKVLDLLLIISTYLDKNF